jgi:hypothetical protein
MTSELINTEKFVFRLCRRIRLLYLYHTTSHKRFVNSATGADRIYIIERTAFSTTRLHTMFVNSVTGANKFYTIERTALSTIRLHTIFVNSATGADRIYIIERTTFSNK